MKRTAPFLAALEAVGPERKKQSFKVTYQVWCTSAECWLHNEFYLFAPDLIEAKRRAVTYCRDNNGQPIDYHNLEVAVHHH
jgi:hypothetical protein